MVIAQFWLDDRRNSDTGNLFEAQQKSFSEYFRIKYTT